MFLLKDGSLTWMNMAYFMVQMMPCASLPFYGETVYIEIMSCDLAMLVDGGGSEVFFEPIPKDLPYSSMY